MPLLRECTCGKKAYDCEDLELFVKKNDSKHGRKNKCKECAATEHREKWSKQYELKRIRPEGYSEFRKENWKYWDYKSRFGIDLSSIDMSKCEICERTSDEVKMVIDHDHSTGTERTGKMRGILCIHCNSNLGYFEDSFKSGIKKSSISKTFNVDKAFKYIQDRMV